MMLFKAIIVIIEDLLLDSSCLKLQYMLHLMKLYKGEKNIPSVRSQGFNFYIYIKFLFRLTKENKKFSKELYSADWVKVCQARNQSDYEQSIPAVQGGYFEPKCQLPMKVFNNKGDRAEEEMC